jgi:asparagine synthase (glutamine-hydrolysing)
MSGEGSDELFGGYPYFGIEAIWRQLSTDPHRGHAALARFRADEAMSRGMFWDDGDAWKRAPRPFGFASAYTQRIQAVTRASRFMFSRSWLSRRTRTPMEIALEELDPSVLRGLAPFDATRLVARSVLGSLVIPSLGDRVEMAHSLEGRVPFLDLDVVERAYALSEAHCIDPVTLVRKRVLRHAFGDLIPKGHRAPPKHTLMAPPLRDLLRTPRGRVLLETLTSDLAIRNTGVFDPLFVRSLRTAFAICPERAVQTRAGSMLDLTLTYVLTTQALHYVFVEDGLARRGGEPRLALDEDRSPPPTRGLELAGGAQ